MNNAEKVVSTFLYYGYFPRVPDSVWDQPWARYALDPRIREARLESLSSGNEAELAAHGVRIFRDIFSDVPQGTHVVPLSGGLDSRAILAGLLGAGVKNDLVAVTYGTPGSLDYEIPPLLCRQAGVRHERIDLTNMELPQGFDGIGCATDLWFFFDAAFRTLITSRFGADVYYWSGFMGGSLAGAHTQPVPSPSWESARSRFVSHNRMVASDALWHPDYRPEEMIPALPIFDGNLLNYDDQLDFAVRQMSVTHPVVMQRPYRWQAPLVDPEWVYFLLTVPHRLRVRQRVYRRILRIFSPELFSLPTNNECGLPIGLPHWLVTAHKMLVYKGFGGLASIAASVTARRPIALLPRAIINYINFDEALRRRKEVAEVIASSIAALKERQLVGWLDVDSLWQQHMKQGVNHGYALFLLAALEMNLRRSKGKVPELEIPSR